MATWQDCFNYLCATLTNPGMADGTQPFINAYIFNLNQKPKVINRADLPCLVFNFDERLKAGIELINDYSANHGETTIKFEQWCLVGATGQGTSWDDQTIRLLDDYEKAIAKFPDLNGRLSKAMQLSNKRIGKLNWGLVQYFGFAIELTWTRRF